MYRENRDTIDTLNLFYNIIISHDTMLVRRGWVINNT